MTDDPLSEQGQPASPKIPPKKPRPLQGFGRNAGLKVFERERELAAEVARVREAKRVKIVTRNAAIAAKRPKPGMLQVVLQLRHSINGRNYGPGLVTCLADQAAEFLNTEAACADKERSLVQQQAFIVSFRDGMPTKRQVPWAQFDAIMGQTAIPIDAMGG